jgi:hypothetical protein
MPYCINIADRDDFDGVSDVSDGMTEKKRDDAPP